MKEPRLTDAEIQALRRQLAFDEVYYSVCPRHLTRNQRRSLHGKMLRAQAEAAGLKAENEILQQQLKEQLAHDR